jgi:hypothetical protein
MHAKLFFLNAHSYYSKFVRMQEETDFLHIVPHYINIYTV